MNNTIRDSYRKIKMSDDSKDRIYNEIQSHGNKRKNNKHTLKTAAAVCAVTALIIPAGTYAAGKIYDFYSVKINEKNLMTEIITEPAKSSVNTEGDNSSGHTDKTGTSQKYIKFTADFGGDYSTEETDSWSYYSYGEDENGNTTKTLIDIPEGSYGMYHYDYKDGFNAGKDFVIEPLYVGKDDSSVIKLYDQNSTKELTVNGHRAYLCAANGITGTAYKEDEITSYATHLYIFYDEYGYIIDLHAMRGIDTDTVIKLAGKINVEESSHDNSSRYTRLNDYIKANSIPVNDTVDAVDADSNLTIYNTGDTVHYNGLTYQITDVSVTDNMPRINAKTFSFNTTGLDPDTYIDSGSSGAYNSFRKASDIWNIDGSLKTYKREKLISGDGIDSPEHSVNKIEKIALKSVNITMKVKVDKKLPKNSYVFELPRACFIEKKGSEYVDITDSYNDDYNRPGLISDVFTDCMPCYFKETSGGKGFRLKEIGKDGLKPDKEVTYHFSYILDEDFINKMYVDINSGLLDVKREIVRLEIE